MRIEKWKFATVPLKPVAWKSPIVQTVYFRICGYSNGEGVCFPSIRELREKCGTSENSVRHAIRTLVEIGLLLKRPKIRQNGSQTSNEYEVFTELGEAFKSDIPPLQEVNPPPSGGEGAPLQEVNPHNQTITNQTIEEEDNSLRSLSSWSQAIQKKPKLEKDESKTKIFLESVMEVMETSGTEWREYSALCENIAAKLGTEPMKIRNELANFIDYWMQKNENWRKRKWEKESTFDLEKRLRYWLRNSRSSFNSNPRKKWTIW